MVRYSGYTLEKMMMPPCSPMGYYLTSINGIYDMTNCLPAFSDNKITPQMLNTMLEELHNHPDLLPYGTSYKFILTWIGFPILAIGVAMLAMGYDSMVFIIVGAIVAIVGFILLMVGLCSESDNSCRYEHKKYTIQDEIIAKHKTTTFSGIDVVIRYSTYRTYLALDFAWKGLAQPAGMAPAGALRLQNNPPMPNGQFNPYQQVPNSGI